MGQSPSSAAGLPTTTTTTTRDNVNALHSRRSKIKSMAAIVSAKHAKQPQDMPGKDDSDDSMDFISDIPDECVAHIFHFLGSSDRKRCSLVCRRWFEIEGQSRHRLSLNANSDLVAVVPSLFSRFDSITKLSLKCDRRSISINDHAFALISQNCQKLTSLKLRSCREITESGMTIFAKNCKGLKKLSCESCTFGAKGMNALLDNCSSLEELSVKRLRCNKDGYAALPIGPGLAASSLKTLCLKELYNGQCFSRLIIGSKNLRTLRLYRCSGDWDRLLEAITNQVTGLIGVHLETIQVSDIGLAALSKCPNLEILHLVKIPECSNLGLMSIAENCKLLRKLHIDGWKTNRISDEGLIGVSKHCPNLQELVLIGVNPTLTSLERLAMNCPKLERLALCGSETIGDAEISCIAAKCTALRKLCIKSCPVSDHGLEAFAGGCPNLVKIKVKKCQGVTCDGADWLRASRESLTVNLDAIEVENIVTGEVAGASESVQEVGAGNRVASGEVDGVNHAAERSSIRSMSFKARLGNIAGRNVVACTLRKWSSFSGRSRSHRY